MSWLNNSLNTIKGQLTTLAQEVLAETAGPGDEEYRGAPVATTPLDTRTTMDLLVEMQKDKEELDKLCTEKEAEILMLRKQVEMLQQQLQRLQQHPQIIDTGSVTGTGSVNSGRNSKSPTDNNGSSPLEDSWCWEPDNIKNDNDRSSETSSGGNSHELVNITLEEASNENTTNVTKSNKTRIQRLGGGGGAANGASATGSSTSGNGNIIQHQQPNVELQKRLQQLEEENKRLNISLDELDTQHNLAMENMLELKTTLQEQLSVLSKNYGIMEREYQEKFSITEKDIANYQKIIEEIMQEKESKKKDFDNMEREYQEKFAHTEKDISNYQKVIEGLLQDKEIIEKENNHCKDQFKSIENELKQKQIELNEVQNLLNKKSDDNNELIELIKERDQKNSDLIKKQEELMQKFNDLTEKQTEAMHEMNLQSSNDNDKKISSDSSNSSSGKQSEDEFIVVREANGNAYSVSGTPPTKEALKDKIVLLENKVSELTTDNEKISMKLDNIIKENERTLEILNDKCKQLFLTPHKEAEIDAEVEDGVEVEGGVEVPKKLSNLKDIIEIIALNENELKLLRTKNELLNRDLEELKDTFNDENNYLTNENERLKSELRSLRKSQTHFNELEQKLQVITIETQQLKLNAEAEAEVSLNHHAGLEDKLKVLSAENALLKTEIERISASASFRPALCTSEEKKTITDLDDEEDKNDLEQLFNKIKDLIIMVKGTSENDTHPSDNYNYDQMPQIYQTLKEKFDKCNEMERSIKEMSEKLLDYQEGKLVWDHEKKTLEADISQYILQCDELMKNNEILLNELENYKRHKLETISEHNEESIVHLEGQLDEVNKLNSTLNKKIDELEMANNKLLEKLRQAQSKNEDYLTKEKHMNLQVETLELEKCKLLLELNNLQSQLDNESALKQNDEQLEQLKEQIQNLTKEYNDQKEILENCMQDKIHLQEELLAKDIIVENFKGDMKILQSYKHKAEEQIELLQKELSRQTEQINNIKLEERQLLEIQKEKQEIEQKLRNVEAELAHCKNELENLHENKEIAAIEEEKKVLMHEKQEMIKILQQKHSENTQYYSEIQRLQSVLNEMQQQQAQQNQLNDPSNMKICDKCSNYELTIDNLKKEQDKLNDQINFLKEKSNILTTNLLTEQTNQKLMKEENAEILEQNATLRKDLERLRGHLLEIEDMHTQETITMQNNMEQMKQRMLILEDEASQSSTAYTSASIRANQHAETLQAQYALVVQQRDDLVVKLSLAEDRESKNQAAITNLQCALEQFQNNKENDIKLVTQRIRRELQQQCDKEVELKNDIQQLQQQLIEANHGLEAAARLSDQLEASQQTVIVLREEVDTLKQQINELELKLSSSECSQADKIEKSLIKSLLIGYVVSGNLNDKQQILRLIATVLEFTEIEIDKIGLNKSSSGWFGSLLGGSGTSGSNSDVHSKENLVQAFVQFLQQESQPKSNNESQMPNLLNITGAVDSKVNSVKHHNTSKSASSAHIRQQMTTTPVPLLLNSNIIEDFPLSRNSSSILKDILNDT